MRRLLHLLLLLACTPVLAIAATSATTMPDTGTRPAPAAAQGPLSRLLVLSYHDIRDDLQGKGDPDGYAISTQNFIAQIDWLHGNGYRPVSLAQVRAAAAGGEPLPPRPVLLTFDDGLRSVYTHAFPVLRAYGYPALVAVVTGWVDLPADRQVDYGPRPFLHDDFVTWDQLREMQASGLVEIASHSHDMHGGIPSNPQGNSTPAAVTRRYDAAMGRYETEQEYRERIHADLSTSAGLIERELGVRPRAVVWPYAAYNSVTNAIAGALGMEASFDLEGRDQTGQGQDLHGLARLLMFDNPGVDDLVYELRRDKSLVGLRALQVDLDYVYDPDPAQEGRNLDALVERVKQIKPSHVFLQAFADPDGNGSADALYYPNRHLPMRADLFNRVAWQLRTRAGVVVYAWLPVLGFEPADPALRRDMALPESDGEIFRLDPTHPGAQRFIADLYEDLAVAGYFEGLHFHDDAYLRDHELAGVADAAARTQLLVDFTHALRGAAERWRPKLATVRNLYARTVMEPASEAWFAQRLDAYLHAYDYTALMAMPWLEGSRAPEAWMDRLLDNVRRTPGGLERTIFQLQTVDWRSRQPVPAGRLKAQVRRLQAGGARHLAWYPDDFIGGTPPLDDAREAISSRTFPYLER